ncbi:zinc-dependent metalloprotease [Qipengyuania gaetbuli]|uniref:zinc-dependent metalloprotease n=1 Tax=Qipengyuania gaetbuli TaxID=266952 RepID=UPI001CD35FDB|nr:zinc-dependent metalloprotease [Qipengyuania gaetbuli]MCA0910748.1 zinc-dependent metalloprotease [Qipengyuania gaetbuli]
MKKAFLFLGAALLVTGTAQAKDKDEAKDKGGEKGGEEAAKTLAQFVEGFRKTDGLFPLYRDPKTGEVYLELDADQLGSEFIYFTYTENGPVEANHFRGNFRDNRIVTFNKKYDRVEVEAVNTSFYFDPDSALARASEANIARAPIGNVKIAATSEDGRKFLISADALLEKEALSQIKPWQSPDDKPGSAFALGELSEDKTQISTFANFPDNTDIRVEYVFDNPKPFHFGGADITDARSVAILVQHSFLKMPAPGFEPRADDFRVGYFTNQKTDLTSVEHAPYRDVINRWRLEKKDPSAAVSDPVKPITFWIENTTPRELRGTIRDATLAWNEAFEAAGISNAIEVQIQPDDASWDAGDVRYNVMRWTSSPRPPFGGYGPSFTNPRTGEIIGADIMLEYVYLKSRIWQSEIFDTAGLPTYGKSVPGMGRHAANCTLAADLQAKMMAARSVFAARGASDEELDELLRQELAYLVLHEVGHTLGLTHNMRSSHSIPLSSLGSGAALPTNSVMDYTEINIAPAGQPQGQFAIARPGPYDVWAIQYGYTPEESLLPAIVARSTEPALVYGNDADDMRSPGTHIDPRVMIDDLSDDPIGWATQRAALVDQTLAVLADRVVDSGDTYQALVNSYYGLTGQKARAANIASRWIAGVYNNRSVVGQPGAQQPLVPVSVAEQRRALGVVSKLAFAPDAFSAGENLLNRLQVERRGFDMYGTNVDPQPHARALRVQQSLLDHLLHPNVLTRLTDTRRYGGAYPVSTYMAELTGVMFDADRVGAVNTYRQNLQVEYLTRLIGIASGAGGGMEPTPMGPRPLPTYDYVSRSAALAGIARIKAIAAGPAADAETRAHRAHLASLIAAFERR